MAWIGAFAIGLSLGLLGSGGSILTVPVLIYLVGVPEKTAIAESLAIVGLIALAGAIPKWRRGLVDGRNVLLFGLPGMVGAYLGAWSAAFVSGEFQLVLFAVIMFVAAFLMMRPPKLENPDEDAAAPRAAMRIVIDGLIVGAVTGLVGVGGGFLIVPALVLLGGLPMHRAIGTSLAIIALKSATGFAKYSQVLAELDIHMDWVRIVLFSVIGFGGSLLGGALASRLPRATLQRGFGGFLLLMGGFILVQYGPKMVGG